LGALGVGGFRSVGTFAQENTQSFVFPNCAQLDWIAPWSELKESKVTAVVPNSVLLEGDNQGQFVVGFYDAATTVDDAVADVLSVIATDPSQALPIAGGGTETSSYLVHRLSLGDEVWGFTPSSSMMWNCECMLLQWMPLPPRWRRQMRLSR
jgi:hypothetical protein